MDIAIRVEGLKKSFGSQQVLTGVDLEIPRGAVTVVIGRSGTGKSVLLKHLLGLVPPDEGRIEVGGQDLWKMRESGRRDLRARFGMVFQNAALFDSMDVFENVAFPLREHSGWKEDRIEARVREVLASVGLSAAIYKLPSELSGGMRKRAGLARALVRNPDYLLYDEPTTGLDPIMTAQIDALIRETQDQHPGLTSVVISHDMQATFRIADRIAMLHEGRVILHEDREIFRNTDHPVVRQFVEGRLEGPIQPDLR
jgi:phospholipid/cholesterol/gamma-HCH transport system ATP-binding protein